MAKSSRTIRDFSSSKNALPIIERWSHDNGFTIVESADRRRLYRKGAGAVPPVYVDVTVEDGRVHLEGWLSVAKWRKYLTPGGLLNLKAIPSEVALDGNLGLWTSVAVGADKIGGTQLPWSPRLRGRNAFNALLQEFDQPVLTG